MKNEQIIAAYYYLDDVSVILLNDGQKCDCMKEEVSEYSSTIYLKESTISDKMTLNEKIEAQTMFFAFGKSNLTASGKVALEFIAEQMKTNPTLNLDVIGHSDVAEDSVGIQKSIFSNMGEKRTNAVIQYLVEMGIQESRLNSVSKGSSFPNEENSNSDEQDLKMARNRRVTFRVF
jgi:outer membrane protein OmpA-like peptidoglycan-associated protein